MNQPAVPGCPTFAERIIVGASGEIRKQLPAPGHKAGNPRGQVGRIRRRGDTGTGMRVGERLCAVADVPVGVIGLFQRLHYRGQRLPGDAHCLGRLPAVDQPADHGDYLVDLAGVCMGARVLDVAVPDTPRTSNSARRLKLMASTAKPMGSTAVNQAAVNRLNRPG